MHQRRDFLKNAFLALGGLSLPGFLPRLSAAHAQWCATGRLACIAEAVEAGRAHWERIARALLQPLPAAAAALDPAQIRLA